MYLTDAARPLSEAQRAGALLISLGPEAAAAIISQLSPEEVEVVMRCVTSLQGVGEDVRASVLAEFQEAYEGQSGISAGGADFAQTVLGRVLGGEEADKLLARLSAGSGATPRLSLPFLAHATGEQLVTLLADEHPQLIAAALSHLSPDRAAVALGGLPEPLQAEVARRLAQGRSASAEVMAEVDRGLMAKAQTSHRAEERVGPKALAEVLSRVDRRTERAVLEALAPELAEAVRRGMFVFEDLPKLPERELQQVLQTAGSQDLAMALKGADETLQEVVFRNVSERTAEAVKEDMELLARARPKEIEAAQQRICASVREMISSGQIVLEREDAQDPAPSL